MSTRRRVSIWVEDPLVQIRPDTLPENKKGQIELTACQGEYESGQVALRAKDEIIIHLKTENLTRVDGKGIIGVKNLQLRLVGYVIIKENTKGSPASEIICKAPCELPDPLLPLPEEIKLKPGYTQAIWLTVYVPRQASPGLYQGKITIQAGNTKTFIPISLKVLNIPMPIHRPLHLTNHFRAENIAKYHNVKMWSEEHWQLLDVYAQDMGKHGQDTIMTPLELVDIWQEKDGELTFDYNRFDRWIKTFDKYGVAKLIELGHVGARKKEDEFETSPMTLKDFKVNVRHGAEKRKFTKEKKITMLLASIQNHLLEKGWLSRAIIHIADEPTPSNLESWKKISRFVHKVVPKIPRIDAIHVRDCGEELEIYCPELGYFDQWYDHFSQLQKAGKIKLWFYTCCNPTGLYANRFIDYKLIKTRLLHWMNYLYDACGYLHWGLNSWKGDPYDFSQLKSDLPPGDRWIIYPGKHGPNSSIRWETLRDGVEDFQLLWILEQVQIKAAKHRGIDLNDFDPTARGKKICSQIIRSLTNYSTDISALRKARSDLIDAIYQTKLELNTPLLDILCERIEK